MTQGDIRVAPTLADAAWLGAVRPVLSVLGGEAGEARVVGGVVRDGLLGITRADPDIDIATVHAPETVMARARAAGLAVHPTGLAHGTVTVVAGAARAEVTTLREDVATDGRHAQVRFGTDWRADAMRRDFTMNALYCDMEGAVFDPLGGLEDCLARRVRFVGDADQRIAEDRLRVLRFFRFSATHGDEQFDAVGLAACGRVRGDLGPVSAERIGQEMLRLLAAPRVAETLRAMERAGLFATLGLTDVGLGDLAALDDAGFDAGVPGRLALLAEDSAGIEAIRQGWRLSHGVADAAVDVLQGISLAAWSYWNRLRLHAGDAALERGRLARALGLVAPDEWGVISMQLEKGDPGPIPVNGTDLAALGIAPGPQIGRILSALTDLWVGSAFTLDREALLAQVPGVVANEPESSA